MTATLTPPSRVHGPSPISRQPATPSSATTRHAPSKLRSLLSMRELPVIAALIALVLLTWTINPRFLSAQGVRDLFLNATIAMLMAAGQSLIIQSEGVDLSVGSILGCTAFATGFLFATNPGLPIGVVFVAGIVLGALLGALNGLLVTQAKVPAMVITLGTLYVFRGGLNWWAGSTQYFAGDRPQAFGDLGVATIAGFPLLTLLAVIVIVIVSLYQRYARSGRDLYAIGSDRAAAASTASPSPSASSRPSSPTARSSDSEASSTPPALTPWAPRRARAWNSTSSPPASSAASQ